MQKTRIIVGTYNHTPEGAGESEFETAYQVCWRPFLSVLYRFPELNAVVHYSGTVLQWLERRHPEFLMLLDEMATRKQIEILGGAFYAPILPLIPVQDRLGQTEALTTFIRKNFGKKPRGFWIQDYAWEPSLPSMLRTCGFEYSFLPIDLMRSVHESAFTPSSVCLTEDQGRNIAIFPVHDLSEVAGPLQSPEKAIDHLLSECENENLITLMFDGSLAAELWTESGLESPDVLFERSFAVMQRNALVYETILPSKYFRTLRHFRRAYFPQSASRALASATFGNAVQTHDSARHQGRDEDHRININPRQILLVDEAAANLYAKMQYVRILVGQLRGDKSRKKSAQEELWRSQSGNSYWNGRCGGVRNPRIRADAYSALLEAERLTIPQTGRSIGLIRADLDFDGEKELLHQGKSTTTCIHGMGARVFEFDSLRSRTNYADSPDPVSGTLGGLCVDRIVDTEFPDSAFPSKPDSIYSYFETQKSSDVASFGREIVLPGEGGRKTELFLRKTFSFIEDGFSVNYELENRQERLICLTFSSSFHLAFTFPGFGLSIFPAADQRTVREISPLEQIEIPDCRAVMISRRDCEEDLSLRSDLSFNLRHEPRYSTIEDRIRMELRQAYRGPSIIPVWRIDLEPGSNIRFSLTLEISGS